MRRTSGPPAYRGHKGHSRTGDNPFSPRSNGNYKDGWHMDSGDRLRSGQQSNTPRPERHQAYSGPRDDGFAAGPKPHRRLHSGDGISSRGRQSGVSSSIRPLKGNSSAGDLPLPGASFARQWDSRKSNAYEEHASTYMPSKKIQRRGSVPDAPSPHWRFSREGVCSKQGPAESPERKQSFEQQLSCQERSGRSTEGDLREMYATRNSEGDMDRKAVRYSRGTGKMRMPTRSGHDTGNRVPATDRDKFRDVISSELLRYNAEGIRVPSEPHCSESLERFDFNSGPEEPNLFTFGASESMFAKGFNESMPGTGGDLSMSSQGNSAERKRAGLDLRVEVLGGRRYCAPVTSSHHNRSRAGNAEGWQQGDVANHRRSSRSRSPHHRRPLSTTFQDPPSSTRRINATGPIVSPDVAPMLLPPGLIKRVQPSSSDRLARGPQTNRGTLGHQLKDSADGARHFRGKSDGSSAVGSIREKPIVPRSTGNPVSHQPVKRLGSALHTAIIERCPSEERRIRAKAEQHTGVDEQFGLEHDDSGYLGIERSWQDYCRRRLGSDMIERKEIFLDYMSVYYGALRAAYPDFVDYYNKCNARMSADNLGVDRESKNKVASQKVASRVGSPARRAVSGTKPPQRPFSFAKPRQTWSKRTGRAETPSFSRPATNRYKVVDRGFAPAATSSLSSRKQSISLPDHLPSKSVPYVDEPNQRQPDLKSLPIERREGSWKRDGVVGAASHDSKSAARKRLGPDPSSAREGSGGSRRIGDLVPVHLPHRGADRGRQLPRSSKGALPVVDNGWLSETVPLQQASLVAVADAAAATSAKTMFDEPFLNFLHETLTAMIVIGKFQKLQMAGTLTATQRQSLSSERQKMELRMRTREGHRLIELARCISQNPPAAVQRMLNVSDQIVTVISNLDPVVIRTISCTPLL